MFIQTTTALEHFNYDQLYGMNEIIRSYIDNCIARSKDDEVQVTTNIGQLLITNARVKTGEEVNALIDFEFKVDKLKVLTEFKIILMSIFTDDDDEGINYMLENRRMGDKLILLGSGAPVSKQVRPDPLFLDELAHRFQQEFSHLGNDYLRGDSVLNVVLTIIEKYR